MPRPYMSRQEDINARMRTILIDWMIDLHNSIRKKGNLEEKYFKKAPICISNETLHRSIAILDKFLSKRGASRTLLQLVGVCAFWIASKLEDDHPYPAGALIYYTDGAYTKEKLIALESIMLRNLNYDLYTVTSYQFVCEFTEFSSERIQIISKRLVELSLLVHDLLVFRPSLIALTCTMIAVRLDKSEDELPCRVTQAQALYAPDDVTRCARIFIKALVDCKERKRRKAEVKDVTIDALFDELFTSEGSDHMLSLLV